MTITASPKSLLNVVGPRRQDSHQVLARNGAHDFQVVAKVNHAQRLLRCEDLTVTEVAAASDFENCCTFSRSRRQRFGMTAVEANRHGASDRLRSAIG